jgi:predicted permease
LRFSVKKPEMQILYTIVPIFIIVLLGWCVRRRGILPSDFFRPANLLVYYLAIPALIFRAISGASIGENFHGDALFLTLAAVVLSYGLAWLVCRLRRIPMDLAGTFIQSSGHGNLGYIGFAVAFYFLGDSGLVKASLIAGFLMILQNLLSVVALRLHGAKAHPDADAAGKKGLLGSIFGNPVIISAMAGILASFFNLPIPMILQRALDILSGMALPMALLLIGGSLSLDLVRKYLRLSMGAISIKLVVLPGLGLLLFRAFGVSGAEYLPGLILLASPTATITFVLAREMNGAPEFAAANISASTLLSAVTFSLWLMIAG